MVVTLKLLSRYFTLIEAEAALPEAERLLNVCMASKRDYDEADVKLTEFTQRIAVSGGMNVSRSEVAELNQRRDAAGRKLKSAVDGITDMGVQLKDLDIGLLDFPTLYKGEEVYLCWRLGESGIRFWHNVSDGFRGRQPIDSEFLHNHCGESPV